MSLVNKGTIVEWLKKELDEIRPRLDKIRPRLDEIRPVMSVGATSPKYGRWSWSLEEETESEPMEEVVPVPVVEAEDVVSGNIVEAEEAEEVEAEEEAVQGDQRRRHQQQ